jgi:hypothetical protein
MILQAVICCERYVFVVNFYVSTAEKEKCGYSMKESYRITFFFFFLIPFYLQAVQIHSANGVKLLEA